MTMGDSCLILLNSPLTLAATFNLLPLNVPPSPSTIQSTYNAVMTGGVIRVTASTYSEILTCNRNVSTTLLGGYDTLFTTAAGYTTLSGSLVVSSGTLTVDRLVIM